MPPRRFPPPLSTDDPETKLGQDCFIVRDANGHALAYVYFEDKPGRRSAAHLLTRDASLPTSPSCPTCCVSREWWLPRQGWTAIAAVRSLPIWIIVVVR